jgi:hypothetical protein
MPIIRLTAKEASDALPNFCLVCGAKAIRVKRKSLAGFIVQAPLCYLHELHWAIPKILAWTSIPVFFVGAFFCAASAHSQAEILCWSVWSLILLLWLAWLAHLVRSRIRPQSISADEIVLVNVGEDFIQTMVNQDIEPPDPRGYLGPYRLRPLPNDTDGIEIRAANGGTASSHIRELKQDISESPCRI